MHSAAAILIRFALSVLLDMAVMLYVVGCLLIGREIAWKPALGVLLLACTLAPPWREVQGIIAEVKEQLRKMAIGD